MKKLCSRCGQVNEYEADVCAKCGCDLNENEKYKECPSCGKVFDLLKDECPDCRETLIVKGRPAAMVFDETEKKDGMSFAARLFSMLVPVIGFLFALIVTGKKEREGAMSAPERRSFVIVSLLTGLFVAAALYLIIGIIAGNLGL